MPDDLSPEERHELESIRRRKQELLHDIQVITDSPLPYTFNLFVQFVQLRGCVSVFLTSVSAAWTEKP